MAPARYTLDLQTREEILYILFNRDGEKLSNFEYQLGDLATFENLIADAIQFSTDHYE